MPAAYPAPFASTPKIPFQVVLNEYEYHGGVGMVKPEVLKPGV